MNPADKIKKADQEQLKKLAADLAAMQKKGLSEEREEELAQQGWKWLPESGSYGSNDVEQWVHEALDKLGYKIKENSGDTYWTVVKTGDPTPTDPTEAEIDADTVPSHWVSKYMPGSRGARDTWEDYQKEPKFYYTMLINSVW